MEQQIELDNDNLYKMTVSSFKKLRDDGYLTEYECDNAIVEAKNFYGIYETNY